MQFAYGMPGVEGCDDASCNKIDEIVRCIRERFVSRSSAMWKEVQCFHIAVLLVLRDARKYLCYDQTLQEKYFIEAELQHTTADLISAADEFFKYGCTHARISNTHNYECGQPKAHNSQVYVRIRGCILRYIFVRGNLIRNICCQVSRLEINIMLPISVSRITEPCHRKHHMTSVVKTWWCTSRL